MTARVSVTHHGTDDGLPLLLAVVAIDARGDAVEPPLRAQDLAPGVTATVHLHPDEVIVVRERT